MAGRKHRPNACCGCPPAAIFAGTYGQAMGISRPGQPIEKLTVNLPKLVSLKLLDRPR